MRHRFSMKTMARLEKVNMTVLRMAAVLPRLGARPTSMGDCLTPLTSYRVCCGRPILARKVRYLSRDPRGASLSSSPQPTAATM